MRTKCPHCPLRNEDRECPGQRNPRACERADPESPEHDPGILRQILSFTKAFAHHVVAGSPAATPTQKAARLAICGACEHYEPGSKCRLCGCGLDVKAGWADQACPIEKWKAINPSDLAGA